jgi:hypothetical protein
MRGLVDDLGVEGVTLSLVGGGRLAQVARLGPRPGLDVGPLFQIPMYPPFGAAVVAFGTEADEARWLDEVPDRGSHGPLRVVLESVRTAGVAVWRLDAVTELLSEAIFASQAMIDRLTSSRRGEPEGRTGLLSLFDRLGLSVDELRSSAALPVAYLEAPVFDAEGNACYVLEVHVLREAVSHRDRARIVASARAAADALTRECGGTVRSFAAI